MSNIGNKLMSGFYAFPPKQGKHLYNLLKPQGPSAWFDPTAGEGEILHQLASGRDEQITTYGVEVDKGRALAAKDRIDHLIHAPIESMVIQNEAFSFILLNPPYDWSIKGIGEARADRKELKELERNTKYLQGHGVMVYCIPSYRFADEKIARFLATRFYEVALMRFTDEDYEDYKQCVFIGKKKTTVHKELNKKLYDFLLKMDSEEFIHKNVTPINRFVDKKTWEIPSMTKKIKTFYSKREEKSDYYEGIKQSPGLEAFKNRMKPRELEIGGQPILPLNQGQMALLLASGAINGLLGEGEDLHLVQGLEDVRESDPEVEVNVSDRGHRTTKTVTRTKREVSVKILTPSGVIKKLV